MTVASGFCFLVPYRPHDAAGVQIPVQQYKSLRVVVMIRATKVNIRTQTQLHSFRLAIHYKLNQHFGLKLLSSATPMVTVMSEKDITNS